MIVLDSSAVIELLKGTEKGKKIRENINNEAIAITTITLYEVLIGVPARHNAIIREFLKTFEILPFDEDAGYKSIVIEEQLTKRGKLIGKLDIFIASICLVHDLKLLTADNDFKNIEELKSILA